MNQIINAEFLKRKNSGGKITPKYFGIGILYQLSLITRLGIQPKALTRSRPPSSTSSLLSTRLTNRRDQQTFNFHSGIKYFLLRKSRIYHIHNTINSNWSLGDVGGDYYFTTWKAFFLMGAGRARRCVVVGVGAGSSREGWRRLGRRCRLTILFTRGFFSMLSIFIIILSKIRARLRLVRSNVLLLLSWLPLKHNHFPVHY